MYRMELLMSICFKGSIGIPSYWRILFEGETNFLLAGH
jgi:hypothetical protein